MPVSTPLAITSTSAAPAAVLVAVRVLVASTSKIGDALNALVAV